MIERIELNRYLQEVISEARRLDIPVSGKIGQEVKVNTRARSRFGSCKKEKSVPFVGFTIEIGEALLVCLPEVIKSILAHEVLHTCPSCQNHGATWKQYAKKMNQTYGYRITRTTSHESLGILPPEKKTQETAKYRITCSSCGNVIYRKRRSRLITHTRQYRCKCGGRLNCEKN